MSGGINPYGGYRLARDDHDNDHWYDTHHNDHNDHHDSHNDHNNGNDNNYWRRDNNGHILGSSVNPGQPNDHWAAGNHQPQQQNSHHWWQWGN